jgi:predicted XRE-type DNA-binding protein
MSNEREITFDGPYDSPFDLYKDPDRAGNLKVRSKLMNLLAGYIDRKGFNQTEAAEHFGVSQGRISELLNGRISKFTVDYLINMSSRAGIEVDVTFNGTHADSDT